MTDAYQPDDTDLEIIDLLVENGRLTAAEIANRIGDVSERTIRNRLNALIERKLIRIGAMPDPAVLGHSVLADVFIETAPGRAREVADKLAAYDCINYVTCTLGVYDLSIQVMAGDNAELHRFLTDEVGRIPGVRKCTPLLVPELVKTFGYTTRAPARRGRKASEAHVSHRD